jgi:hypothetical protein
VIVVAHPRHRPTSVARPWFVPVPQYYPSTSHRRTRNRLMQITVAELVAGTRLRELPRPWWRRAGGFLRGWAVPVVASEAR